MKLHLPLGLRHGLIKSLMVSRGLLLSTVCSGTLVAGLCAFIPSQTAFAASSAEIIATDDDEDEDRYLRYYNLLTEPYQANPDIALIDVVTTTPYTVNDNEDVTVDLELSVSDKTANLLQMGSNTTLRGTLTLNSEGRINRTSNPNGNAIIKSDFNANGHTFLVWSAGIVFEEGRITNLGDVQVKGPNNVLIFRQDLSPANMYENRTVFKSYADGNNGGGVGGSLQLEGTISGFTEFNINKYNGGAGRLFLTGAFKGAESGNFTVANNCGGGNGLLYMRGAISGVQTFTLTAGTVYIENAVSDELREINVAASQNLYVTTFDDVETTAGTYNGDLLGNGTLTKNGAGNLYLQSNISHTGELVVAEGTVFWSKPDGSNNDTDINTLGFSKITVNTGAIFHINHAEGDQSKTAVALNGGTFKMNDMSPNGAVYITWKQLEVLQNSSLYFKYNGGLSFGKLIGSGDITLTKESGDSEDSILIIDEVNDYNGNMLWANGNNHSVLTIQLNVVKQSAEHTLTLGSADGFTMDATLSNFNMSGEGNLTITGQADCVGSFAKEGSGVLTVGGALNANSGFRMLGGELHVGGNLSLGGNIYMYHSGELEYGSVSLANEAMLYYDKLTEDGELIDFYANGASPTVGDRLWLYVLNQDAETLKEGIDLGLKWSEDESGGITYDKLYALGYARDAYELYKGENGNWFFRTDAEVSDDPEGAGIWDANWGDAALRTRPLSDDMPMWKGLGDAYLAENLTECTGMSTIGAALWARFNSYSMQEGSSIYGGVLNTATSSVSMPAWIYVEGGLYGNVVGGNNVVKYTGGFRADFASDTHIELRKNGSEQLQVFNVFGGNYGDSRGSTFTGDSYISISEGVDVKGFVLGGSLTAHNSASVFVGDSHIFIYGVLSAWGLDNIINSELDRLNNVPNSAPEAVIGGNMFYRNQSKPVFDGSSEIVVDLGGRYATQRSAAASFGKMLIGGDYVTRNGDNNYPVASPDASAITHTGDTHVVITGADGVAFEADVVGGSYMETQASSLIQGSTKLEIDSGTYHALVVGGSVTHGVVCGNNAFVGGSQKANGWKVAANTVIEGVSELNILGGEYNGSEVVNERADGVEYSVGGIALVGGNYLANLYYPTSDDVADLSQVTGGKLSVGESKVSVSQASVHGHIIGSNAAVGKHTRFGGMEAGDSSVSLRGVTADKGGKVVGGMLIAVPTEEVVSGAVFSLGDVKLSIESSSVGDVVGGSWMSGLDAADVLVQQGTVSVELKGKSAVSGDVYAAGIRGGSAEMSTGTVEVSIGSGVKFTKKGTTIISAGYQSVRLTEDEESGEWNEESNAYASYYDGGAGGIGGAEGIEGTLHLSDSADYGENLAAAHLLGFEKITLEEGAKVKVGAIMGKQTELEGAGTVEMRAELVEGQDYEGNKVQLINNDALTLSEGMTLHLLRSESGKNISYLQGVDAASSGHKNNVIIDLAQEGGKNDTLYVNESIEMGSGELTLNLNGSKEMENRALIRSAKYGPLGLPEKESGNEANDEPSVGGDGTEPYSNSVAPISTKEAAGSSATAPSLTLNGTQLTVNIQYLDTELLSGGEHTLLIAQDVQVGDKGWTLNKETLTSLEKWYAKLPTVELEQRGDENYLVITGETVSAQTANFHTKHAMSAIGYVGARMLDNLYTTLNPELSDPNGDRAKLLNALENKFSALEYEDADRTMAAAAGAGLPTLSMAFTEDVERQLRSIRNRTTTMGLNSDYSYDDLPRLQFWVNAEGDYRKIKSEGTNAGYKADGWGGTLGVSADLSSTSTVGLAISAMYSNVDAYSVDRVKGDMSTMYVSGFWRKVSRSWTHTFVATAGLGSIEARRTVEYGEGSYSTKAEPKGYGVGVMYEVGYSIPMNAEASVCAQPVVNISWQHTKLGGFSEKGSDAGLRVGDMKYENVIIAGGVRVQALTGGDAYNRSSIVEGRMLVKGYTGDRAGRASVGFMGANYQGTVSSREAGAFGLELGGGLTVPFEQSALFMDVSAELRSAHTSFNATIGYKFSF